MTLSNAERNAIVDGILEIAGEDYGLAARCLLLLQRKAPGIAWQTLLQNRAAIWAPFTASGLSITWWCAEVARLAV